MGRFAVQPFAKSSVGRSRGERCSPLVVGRTALWAPIPGEQAYTAGDLEGLLVPHEPDAVRVSPTSTPGVEDSD
jgi:hypothetical protein